MTEMPTPWTPEQIAAWNEEHDVLPPGGAVEFEARLKANRARLKELKKKGVKKMTQAEKDEALELLLERLT